MTRFEFFMRMFPVVEDATRWAKKMALDTGASHTVYRHDDGRVAVRPFCWQEEGWMPLIQFSPDGDEITEFKDD